MISCDYTFMTVNGEDDGRAKPILVMKDSRTTSVAATFVDAKGPTPYAVKYFSNFLKTLGYKRVLLQSDGEPSMLHLRCRPQRRLVWKEFHVNLQWEIIKAMVKLSRCAKR